MSVIIQPRRQRTPLERELRPIYEFIADLLKFPMFRAGYTHVKDVDIVVGNVEVEHRLGRFPTAVIVTKADTVISYPALVAATETHATLSCVDVATVNLLFF